MVEDVMETASSIHGGHRGGLHRLRTPQGRESRAGSRGKVLHICGSDFYYDSFAALCERLAKLAPGPSKKRVFLSNSGTEASKGRSSWRGIRRGARPSSDSWARFTDAATAA